jgi:ubiquinone/menaquinone biosynthesis C-methylase UbiE
MEKSPLRRLIDKLWEENCKQIDSGHRVLEVGCGRQSHIKEMILLRGAKWTGLDPQATDLATIQGSVSKIPLPNHTFDVVICSQSIEHWYEYITTFEEGLREIFRVLKPGGQVFFDFPIFLHGHPYFMLGNTKKIMSIFNPQFWKIRSQKALKPQISYNTWDGKRRKLLDQWFMEQMIIRDQNGSYIQSVVLEKKDMNLDQWPDAFFKSVMIKMSYLFLQLLRYGCEIVIKNQRK